MVELTEKEVLSWFVKPKEDNVVVKSVVKSDTKTHKGGDYYNVEVTCDRDFAISPPIYEDTIISSVQRSLGKYHNITVYRRDIDIVVMDINAGA